MLLVLHLVRLSAPLLLMPVVLPVLPHAQVLLGVSVRPGEGRGRRLGVLSVQNVHLLHLRSGRESEYRLSSEGSKDGNKTKRNRRRGKII